MLFLDYRLKKYSTTKKNYNKIRTFENIINVNQILHVKLKMALVLNYN